tara:strand:+ start:116 stop:325 length:210 start_codon:yes stop_codon:yes gene_type:complete
MKILKFIPLILILTLFSSHSFAAENEKCEKLLKAETGVKMLEAWKCENEGETPGETISKKLKNIFKKKN